MQLRETRGWDCIEVMALPGLMTFLLWKFASHFDETEVESLMWFLAGLVSSKLVGRVPLKR